MNEYAALCLVYLAFFGAAIVIFVMVNNYADKSEKKSADLNELERRARISSQTEAQAEYFKKQLRDRRKAVEQLQELQVKLEPEEIIALLKDDKKLNIIKRKLKMKAFW